jgi:hypothetical protein
MNFLRKMADKALPSDTAEVPTQQQPPIPGVNAEPTQAAPQVVNAAGGPDQQAPAAAVNVTLAPTAVSGLNPLKPGPQDPHVTQAAPMPGMGPAGSNDPHNTESASAVAAVTECSQDDLAKPQTPAEVDLPPEALDQISLAANTSGGVWNIVNIGYGRENASIETIDGAQCISVKYPSQSINPGSVKNLGRPCGGLGFYAVPEAVFPAIDLELSYKLAFAPTFDPCCGGKLPGIFLTDPGCHHTEAGSGGRFSDHMASLRLMWRADMQAEAYVYSTASHDSQEYLQLPQSHLNPDFGDSIWRGMFTFKKEGWNHVTLRIKLNTLGKHDGIMAVSVNGKKLSFDKMCWRKAGDVVIAAVFFSTFYGGSSERFACPCDTQIYYKDFHVHRLS